MKALCVIYVFAASLCLGAALSVIGSLFIADRVPQSTQFFWISIAVSSVFLSIGALLLGIQRHVIRIGKSVGLSEGTLAPEAKKSWAMLLVYMSLGGLALSFFLLILLYAILARIDQGFAVFG